jgi:glycosyltransferase involved in cell wall biosynthesis
VRICIVAYVVPAHGIGGMQDHTRDLARGLVRAGHEVDVITSRHPEGGSREEVIDGVRYIFVDAPRQKYHPVWLRESYSEFIRREAERPFDVLHSESASTVELFRRGVHRRVPVVLMLHGAFLGLAKAQLKSALRTRRPMPLLRAIRGVQWLATNEAFRHGNWYRFRAVETIVPSRQQVNDTRRSCLLKESRVHVVPNGIDAELFRPRPMTDARANLGFGGGPIFVAVGRLSPDKGFHHAVQALALMDGEASCAKLVIVGEGPERQRLERLARQLEIEERVIFAGTQTHEGVALHLAAADVFLFPTERDEAAPLILPQAMACGRPVIASRTGGITEVIGEAGEYGVLLPPGDATVLAREMRTLLSDSALRHRLGEAARRRVLAEYTIERMVERTLDVYRIAIARLGQEAAASHPNPSSAQNPGPTGSAS